MLEYGIKAITTNPTLITKANDIIRLVDSRNNETRAFVLPVSYKNIVEKIVKEVEFRKWVDAKKEEILDNTSENLDDIMLAGMDSIESYMKEPI